MAYKAWIAEGEPTQGPFKMKEYVPPGTTEAMAADQRADSRFADALVFNQRGDNYTILTVLFALVLFFAAASSSAGQSARSVDLARPGDDLSGRGHGDSRDLPDRYLICVASEAPTTHRGPSAYRLRLSKLGPHPHEI